jgi:hypothetical protein
MAWFKKKADPITERAKALNDQIAALEVEIQKLAEQRETASAADSVTTSFGDRPTSSTRPRLRSTARPRGPQVPAAAQEPVFEEVGQNRIKSTSEPPPSASQEQDLGVRRDDLGSTWERLKNHFRGPVASNPKLVHYLSAGSIQGLRPLRYEKRVARNRFIVLAVALVLLMWALIAIFISKN